MAKKREQLKTRVVDRVLSVRQPWAQLIITGKKKIEYRTWSTPYRGTVAIRASSTMTKSLVRDNGLDPEKLVTGKIIGIVDIADCVSGRRPKSHKKPTWRWILKNPRSLNKPLTAEGHLGLYRLKKKIRVRN